MARGGKRQGQPGKAYSNRTDLLTNRAPTVSEPPPPTASVPTPAASQGPPMVSPDQTPNLMDPGAPSLPLQDGLATGPGAGPTPPPADDEFILRYLPALERAASLDGAPPQFKSLVRYLQGK